MAIVTSAVAIVTSAKTSHVSSAEATHVTSTETAHVTSSAKAAAVEATATKAATTEAAAPVSAATTTTATATTAACLCTRRKQRPGKQGGCQYHHRLSSSHVFSFRRAEPSVIIELVSLASYDRPAAHR
jgi:hypothetical protein